MPVGEITSGDYHPTQEERRQGWPSDLRRIFVLCDKSCPEIVEIVQWNSCRFGHYSLWLTKLDATNRFLER